ncbi:MAG: sporulation integral membrane protein YtvI, partial [Mesobacillus sp.]
MNPNYLHRTLRFLFVIGLVVAGVFALFFVSKVTYPFIIGFLIAFMMNPLVNFFQERAKMPRSLA